jgi:adenine-specific DNA-methyltransferase
MERLTVTDFGIHSADIEAGNTEKLNALFPEAFTEGRVDFEGAK